MARFYVVGGKQRREGAWGDEWHAYERAVVVEVEVDGDGTVGGVTRRLDHVTPPDACASDDRPGIVFKAATLANDRLYLCTQTEVMCYRVPSFEQELYLSLPQFNDLHHVCPTADGTLLVVSTGLDLVLELTATGEVVNEWDVLGREPWGKFSRDVDYRRVVTTKPHDSHPNHVFKLDDEVWVTRFEQRDAICLTADGSFAIDLESPHDGLVRGGRVYFTTVDGRVAIFDRESRERVAQIDLAKFYDLGENEVLGWCRGLEVLGDDQLVVGFSRLRETRFRENLRWVKSRALRERFMGSLPTRVALFDLSSGERRWEIDLEPHEVNGVFSIHQL